MMSVRRRAICTGFFALMVVLPVAGETDELSVYRRSLWFPRGLGAALITPQDAAHPLSALRLPHLTSDNRSTMLGGAGGVVTGDGISGGALALTTPTRRMVWTGGGAVLHDREGSLLHGVLGVARPLGSRLSAGAAVDVTIANGEDDRELAAAVDLGVRYRLGAVGDFSRVEVHSAMLGLGSGAERDGRSPVVPPFTPVFGLRTRLIDSEDLELDAAAAVSWESFDRLWIDSAVAVHVSQRFSLSVGVDVPFGGPSPALWPGLSAAIQIPLGLEDRTELGVAVQPTTDGTVLVAGDFATAFPSTDRVAPSLNLTVDAPREERVSVTPGLRSADLSAPLVFGLSPIPGNDQLLIDVSGDDERAIQRIEAVLLAPNGREVESWDLQPVGEPIVEGTITERLTSDLAQRRFSGSLFWDVRSATTDGRYRLVVATEDAAGNRTEAPEIGVLVDRQPPVVELDLVVRDAAGNPVENELVDSEDSEGELPPYRLSEEQDVQILVRYGDAAHLSLELLDQAGRVVFPLEAVPRVAGNEAVVEAAWTGSAPDGSPVPAGIYRLRVIGRDELGNTTRVESRDVVVERRPPVFRLTVDGEIVSPNGDGVRDTISVLPELSPLPGLRDWTISLFDAGTGEVVRTWSGIDLPPQRLLLSDTDLPRDGEYYLRGVSRYANGGSAVDETRRFLVDRRAPAVGLGLSDIVIGPGEGRQVVLFLEGDGTAQRGAIELYREDDASPQIIAEFDRLPEEYEWTLLGPEGSLLPPGLYALRVVAEDRAGNRAASPLRQFELLGRLTGDVEVVPQRDTFSPNGDGAHDVLILALGGLEEEETGDFTVTISGTGGSRRYRGTLPLPDRVVWDGRDDNGLPMSDGTYLAELTVEVPERGTVVANSSPFSLDTQAPRAVLQRRGERVISPDGDGVQDRLVLAFGQLDRADVISAELDIVSRDGRELFRRMAVEELGQGSDSVMVVDPRGDDGSLLADGDYAVTLRVEDRAGNVRVSPPVEFSVDTRPVSGYLRVSTGAISPNGDGVADTVTVEPVVPDVRGMQGWRLAIHRLADGVAVLSRQGGGNNLPQGFQWPPVDEAVSDGEYRAVLEASFEHGPQIRTESPVIQVDTTAPRVQTNVDPIPFSPDGDGRADTVAIFTEVEDASSIAYWVLEVFDPVGAFFFDLGERGPLPESIRWDGKTRNGERVVSAEQYPWRLEVADALGNIRVVDGAFSVDVLVEPYEDGYRIQIPSITFPGNSSDLILDQNDPRGQENATVLNRLVEILQRFPEYSIVVEGHAVNLSGTEREENEELLPLSQARAEAVRRALVDRGVAARLLSARGRGGSAPVVSHGDEQNRWKNRRVDFILRR